MPVGIWFWIIFVLTLLFWVGLFYIGWPYLAISFPAILMILIGLLGWKVFGSPVQK